MFLAIIGVVFIISGFVAFGFVWDFHSKTEAYHSSVTKFYDSLMEFSKFQDRITENQNAWRDALLKASEAQRNYSRILDEVYETETMKRLPVLKV